MAKKRRRRVEGTTGWEVEMTMEMELMAPLPRYEQVTTTEGVSCQADMPPTVDPAPIEPTTPGALVSQRELSNMQAIRVRTALARWRCPVCGRTTPRVYNTYGDVRHVQCHPLDGGCGMTGSIVVRPQAP